MSESMIETYNGWAIYERIRFYSRGEKEVIDYYAVKDTVQSASFNSLIEARAWIDGIVPVEIAAGGTSAEGETYFSPDLHNWVGSLVKADLERENKLVALGPAPPGRAGKYEGLLLVGLILKFSKTPEGMRILREWGVAYLNNIGAIIRGISTSSAANVYNCIVNQYTAVRIYQRMGLISAHDAVQTCAWCDHVMGEMLKKEYFKESIGGLTTLVNATTETGVGGERATGLASLAKLLKDQY